MAHSSMMPTFTDSALLERRSNFRVNPPGEAPVGYQGRSAYEVIVDGALTHERGIP